MEALSGEVWLDTASDKRFKKSASSSRAVGRAKRPMNAGKKW
jgi:hypothetical protein